jgi:hypothetical protein
MELFLNAALWQGEVPVFSVGRTGISIPCLLLHADIPLTKGAALAVDVTPSTGAVIKARFPFSHVIYTAVETLRSDAEALEGDRSVAEKLQSLMINGRLQCVANLEDEGAHVC